jgi:hypothetical protein
LRSRAGQISSILCRGLIVAEALVVLQGHQSGETATDDEYLASTYGISVVLRSPLAPHVVGFAPVSSLCPLSNDPIIEYVQRIEPVLLGPPGIANP